MTDKIVLQAEKQMIKDVIVELASRLVKDTEDSIEVRGMIEVGARWVKELDKKLFELDQIERKISH
jgi:hypothetical protein